MKHEDDMLPTLRVLGDNLGDAVRRDLEAERAARRARRRSPRRLVAVAAGVLLVAAGAAGAASLISVGEPLPDHPAGERLAPSAGQSMTFALQAPDPEGGLPWAVATYRNATGLDCAAAGRRRGGRLGFMQAGRFRPRPAAAGGVCGDLARRPLTLDVLVAPETRPYTLVFGRARASVSQVRISGPDGVRLVPTARGAFLAVYDGRVAPARLRVRPVDG